MGLEPDRNWSGDIESYFLFDLNIETGINPTLKQFHPVLGPLAPEPTNL